ncbi:Uncharacterised protein [Bordetella pertussis]|nr:Uncharacterised protein [Bordetella pertussis]
MLHQGVHGEPGEVRQVRHLDAQQIVHVPRHRVALHHFGP